MLFPLFLIPWKGLKQLLKTESVINTFVADEIEETLRQSPPLFGKELLQDTNIMFVDTKTNEILVPSSDMVHTVKIEPTDLAQCIQSSLEHCISVVYTDLSFLSTSSHTLNWDWGSVISLLFVAWKLLDDITTELSSPPPPPPPSSLTKRTPHERKKRNKIWHQTLKTSIQLFIRKIAKLFYYFFG